MNKNVREKSVSQQRVEKFMGLIGTESQNVPNSPIMPNASIRELRAKLILEECLETVRDLGFATMIQPSDLNGRLYLTKDDIILVQTGNETLVGIADGCADIAVVTTGTLSACGLSDVSIQECVDMNNLEKFGPGHSFREDGKLIKPPGHKPPDLEGVIEAQRKEVILSNIGKGYENKVFGLINFEEPGMPWTRVVGKFELVKLDDGSGWEDNIPHWEVKDNKEGDECDNFFIPENSVTVLLNDSQWKEP